jgi:F0F1-type ATP synthase membrane subunit b/b'
MNDIKQALIEQTGIEQTGIERPVAQPARTQPLQDVDEQVRALLQVIDLYQMRRCEEIARETEHQAADIVKQAYHEARQRLHQAIVEERAKGRAEIAALQAQLQTQRRQRQQQHVAGLLQRAMKYLQSELLQRWSEPATRSLWVERLLHQGLAMLPHKDWHIACPPDWPSEEQGHARTVLSGRIEGSLEFQPDPTVRAGLRICSAATCLDGTLHGLLVDRRAIEARLLDLLSVDTR